MPEQFVLDTDGSIGFMRDEKAETILHDQLLKTIDEAKGISSWRKLIILDGIRQELKVRYKRAGTPLTLIEG